MPSYFYYLSTKHSYSSSVATDSATLAVNDEISSYNVNTIAKNKNTETSLRQSLLKLEALLFKVYPDHQFTLMMKKWRESFIGSPIVPFVPLDNVTMLAMLTMISAPTGHTYRSLRILSSC